MITKFKIFERSFDTDNHWFVDIVPFDDVENIYKRIKKYGVEESYFYLSGGLHSPHSTSSMLILIYTDNENKHYNFNDWLDENIGIKEQLDRDGEIEVDPEEWITTHKYNL